MIDYESEDIRYLRKWLNEESTAPIDRQALARVLAAIWEAQQVAPTGWMAIESAPKGKKVIVGYWNKLSKWRTVMACYYLPQTLQMEDDRYDFDDDGYAPEGWYEECESQESILPTEETPVRWMPLPPLPAPECGVKGLES